MAFVINTFAVADDEHLGRFMMYMIQLCDAVGKIAVLDKIEIMKLSIGRHSCSFKPAFGHTADRATSAVFKDNLWYFSRTLVDEIQLFFAGKNIPIHYEFTAFFCVVVLATAGQPVFLLYPQLASNETANVATIAETNNFFILCFLLVTKILYER